MTRNKEVLGLLQQGKTVREIAQVTGTTVGNIKSHKKRLVEAGLWKGNTPQLPQLPHIPDLDQITDFLIDRLEKAKGATELEIRVNRLENQRAALENELRMLRQELQGKEERRKRYNLAIQQGEINKPLVTS